MLVQLMTNIPSSNINIFAVKRKVENTREKLNSLNAYVVIICDQLRNRRYTVYILVNSLNSIVLLISTRKEIFPFYGTHFTSITRLAHYLSWFRSLSISFSIPTRIVTLVTESLMRYVRYCSHVL